MPGGVLPPELGITQTAEGGLIVSATDKLKNKAQELQGHGKEKTGEATGDESLKAEGQRDQSAGNLKDAGEKVKDAFK